MRHLRGRTVVVTGAARGLGAALAQAFDDRGARLALLGLEESACRKWPPHCTTKWPGGRST